MNIVANRVSPLLLLAAVVSLVTPALAVDAVSPGFHFLAADPSLRAQMQNTNVIMGQATYFGKVLELDQSWEAPFKIGYPGSVVVDPSSGQWRMYYELMEQEIERVVAMATSTDGIHWTKPELNLTGTKYTTDPRNNIVNNISSQWIHGPSVFIDPSAPAGQRYRMTADVYNGQNDQVITLGAYSSADGLNWQQEGTIQIADWTTGFEALDAQNTAFRDPKTQQYVSYMRYWHPAGGGAPHRRGVMIKRSDAWGGDWTAPLEYTIDPKDIAGIVSANKADIYCPGVVPYKGQYVGLPAMFYHPNGGVGAIYPTFMYSRDGTDWSFEDVYHPMLDLAAHGQDEQTFGMAFPATSLIEHDGWLYIYHTYSPNKHNQESVSGQMCLSKLREDRFVGIRSNPGTVATWTTSNILLSDDPGQLVVNAVVDGSLRVEVLDPATLQPFAGYSAADGVSIMQGDFLDAIAKWNGADNLNAFAGQEVALRFVMDDATVYSFYFEPAPEPSTVVLLICAGVCLLVFRRRFGGWAWRTR